MENSASKAEVLQPSILKAGVPLAVSLAAFICGWIMAKKSLSTASLIKSDVNSHETRNTQQENKREESFHGPASRENEEPPSLPPENPALEQEISELRGRIEDLLMKELALRLQFDRLCDMKEQEILLMEIRNLLSQETARAEFLEREISSMEAEYRRLEGFLVQYLRIIGQLEDRRSENRLLRRKLKKLQKKSRAQSRLIKEQTLKIKALEAEILENRGASQVRIGVIIKLEDEVRKLHRALEQSHDEKKELLKKLDETEKSYASQIEAANVRKEEYKQLLNELEQLKKERGDEAREVIHLRWINACLRRKLMGLDEQQKNEEIDHTEEEYEVSSGVVHPESEHELDHSHLKDKHPAMSCFGVPQGDGARTKGKKLLKKMKRWVGGREKARVIPEEKEGHEAK